MAESQAKMRTELRLLHNRGGIEHGEPVTDLDRLNEIGGTNIRAILVLRQDGDIDFYAGPGGGSLHPSDGNRNPGSPIRHNGVTVSRVISAFGSPGCIEINGKEYCD